MLKFAYKGTYNSCTDHECMPLLNALNSLPGVKTNSCHRAYLDRPFWICFECNSDMSLRFLGRCVDRRYWKFGHLWQICLTNSDTNYNSAIFELSSCSQRYGITAGSEANEQALDLLENMEWNLNCKNYMKTFIFTPITNCEKFNIKEE